MKNFLNKAMLTLVVFGLAIVSSFAMETDPPTEPIKTTVEIEVVDDVQPPLVGYGYIDPDTGQCTLYQEEDVPTECSPFNPGTICTGGVNGIPHNLYFMSRPSTNDPWVCGDPLRKPEAN